MNVHKVIQGDVRKALSTLADESADCVVTSPPYWGLRDYKIEATIWDGLEGCQHEWGGEIKTSKKRNPGALSSGLTSGGMTQAESNPGELHQGSFCSKCSAWRGQLGLEPSFQLYVKHITGVFHQVKRVLRNSGSLFLNLGDTYNSVSNNWNKAPPRPNDGPRAELARRQIHDPGLQGLPVKCLIGIPERVMLSMIDDGWILRNKVIWHKPNHMPSSVKDRFSNGWEALFFFVKAQKYWFDLDAVREPYQYDGRKDTKYKGGPKDQQIAAHECWPNPAGKNPSDVFTAGTAKRGWASAKDICFKRGYDHHIPELHKKRDITTPNDFWKISTQPFPEAHFATFPEALPERCIKAGCPVGGIVLDPFAGSGTVALVAKRLQRSSVSIEIKPEYVEILKRRIDFGHETVDQGIEWMEISV